MVTTARHGCLFICSNNLKFNSIEELLQVWVAHLEISQWCGGTVASCGAVCARAGSSFGAPARRPEPCWVIDKRLGSVMMELSGLPCGFLLAVALPTHSETHQNATSHLIRPEFLSPADRLGCSFHFSGTVQAREMMMGTHGAPSLQKSHFGEVCERGRKRPNFLLSRGEIRAA